MIIRLSDWVTKWPSDQVTKWPSDQVTKWPSDRKLCRQLIVWYISYWVLYALLSLDSIGAGLGPSPQSKANCISFIIACILFWPVWLVVDGWSVVWLVVDGWSVVVWSEHKTLLLDMHRNELINTPTLACVLALGQDLKIVAIPITASIGERDTGAIFIGPPS